MGHYVDKDFLDEDNTPRWQKKKQEEDVINWPKHYNSDPSGIQPIEITQHMSFCLGNVQKYIMRAKYKGKELEDLKKAQWYLNKEIERLEAQE